MATERKVVGKYCNIIQQKTTDGKKYSIQKYYGWLQLKNIKIAKKKRADTMYQTLLLIVFRVKASQFIQNIQLVSNSIIEEKY